MFIANTSARKPLIVEASQPERGVIIWLHGLGADQYDLVPISGQLDCGAQLRHLFVQAPTIAVTINEGVHMPGWYDLCPKDMGISAIMQDEARLHNSVLRIAQLIQEECARGVAPERIVLIGFSQGGSLALATALSCHEKLGGSVCLSGWLVSNPVPQFSALKPGTESVRKIDASHREQPWPPVLIHHGVDDEVVPHQSALLSRSRLCALGLEPQWADFDINHSIATEQHPLINRFLKQCLDI